MSSVDPAAVLKRAYTEGVNPDYLAAGGFASDDMARVIGQGGGSGAQLRQATVTGYSPAPGTAVIVIGGGGTEYEARCLDGYAPVLGDTVWALRQGADTLVIGPVGGGASHARGPSGTLSVGTWYRIGILRSAKMGATDRASAEFIISDPASGRHNFLRIRASVGYNPLNGVVLKLEDYAGYSGQPQFRRARIVALDSTDRIYSGAALDIWVNPSTTTSGVTVQVRNDNWPGGGKWEAVPFQDKGTANVPADGTGAEQLLIQRGLWYTGDWTALTLKNSWANYGGGWKDLAVTMDPNSVVRLRGLIRNGTLAQACTTLPEGLRPEGSEILLVGNGDTGTGRVDVNLSGDLIPRVGVNTQWWSFWNITYTAYS